jgi:hypothetical protein
MRKYYLEISSAILGSTFIIMVACTPVACFDETNAFVKTSLYLNSTRKLLAPDSLTVYGINMDTSIIYNNSKNITKVLLPLNASADSCGFVIMINGVIDTITFSYSTYPILLSKECGYTFYHTIDTPLYSRNIIDTITVLKNTITTLNEENIRIYY